MRRMLPLVASIITAVLVLTGCGTGPSQTDAAAVVGERVVPLELIQERLRTSGPDLQAAVDSQAAQVGRVPGAPVPSAVLGDQARRLVTVSVLHDLVAEQSRRSGIVVTPEQVDAVLAGAGGAEQAAAGSGFAPATVRELVGDQIAVGRFGRQIFDRIAVTADYVTVGDRATADALAERIAAAPSQASALIRGTPGGEAAQVLRPGRATRAGGPASATSVVYGLPEGSVAVTPAGDTTSEASGGPRPWTVVHVLDRTLTAPPPAGRDIRAATIGDDAMISFGLRLLQPLALELGVRVNPRYGAWDPTQLAVVPSPALAGTVRQVDRPQRP